MRGGGGVAGRGGGCGGGGGGGRSDLSAVRQLNESLPKVSSLQQARADEMTAASRDTKTHTKTHTE